MLKPLHYLIVLLHLCLLRKYVHSSTHPLCLSFLATQWTFCNLWKKARLWKQNRVLFLVIYNADRNTLQRNLMQLFLVPGTASLVYQWVKNEHGEPLPQSQRLDSTVQTGKCLWTPHLWKVNTEKEILLPRALKHSPCKRKKDFFKEFFMQREEEALWSPG